MTKDEDNEAARIAALHKSAPEVIWLQVDPESEQFDGWEAITWCTDQINDTDVKYVRADQILKMSKEPLPAQGSVDVNVGPHTQAVADHIEQRMRTWRQRRMNRSGDQLALDDFMGEDSIADLVDFVCDEYALDAILCARLIRPKKPDCGEAGYDEGRCGNA